MSSDEAVSAFARACKPNGILSGIYAFHLQHACNMIRPGDRVLDLGCGPASLLASIAVLHPDCRFVGVDLSHAMIAKAKQVVQEMKTNNVEIRHDDMTTLSSVRAGSIDVVLSSMTMHHLADAEQLHRCFQAIERVMAPGARVFISDFGRIKSQKSVDYFVQRAIPHDEPILERDYRASLRAAFSTQEFGKALPARLKQSIRIYSTPLSSIIVVLMTRSSTGPRRGEASVHDIVKQLPHNRRADLWQLRLFLRLGGMPWR